MENSITDFHPGAVVLDAGTFPTNPYPLRFLRPYHMVVCCDGAANEFIASGGSPWRIVGDCDSLSPEIKEEYADRIRQDSCQETNDQTKAVYFLATSGVTEIAILGATGKREDHTLGNITLLPYYLHEFGVTARIYTDYGVFIPALDTQTFYCPKGTQVSIFNFNGKELKSEGLRYPIYDFFAFFQGTLNETTDDHFTIHGKGYYLVFINYPKN